ncbi:MAG: aldo/keto reductase [Treponema sp.]|nr:aldo/keto reductase [Treponema sp.]
MLYTEIAGRKVSAMSLGTVQLGMNYGIANREGKPDRDKSFTILSAAVEEGITAIDTARAYGDSEEVIGSWFKAHPGLAEKLFVTTKLSAGLPGGSSASDVEKAMTASVETSLLNLGLRKVNCLMLHNAADMITHGPAVAAAMRHLVAGGLTDMAGVSVYHPHEIDTVLKDDIYRAVQLPMSVFDLRFLKSGALERLQAANIHIFVRSVFFQGLLFLDPQSVEDPDLVRFAVPYIKKLNQLSQNSGMGAAQFAVTFLRDIKGIASLVLGADNPAQVKQNSALFETPVMDAGLRLEAENAFAAVDYPGIMSVLSRPKQQ